MRIAILEDDGNYRKKITEYIEQYQEERGIEFQITAFSNGMEILDGFCGNFDIILLDIEMPGLNGMEVAREIRRQDADVVLVFITNLAEYAIQGYEVDALDFVLKPINYYNFSVKLERAIKRADSRASGEVVLFLPEGVKRLSTRKIYYVDIQGHTLRYHTDQGVFGVRGTMQQAEKELAEYHFFRCNVSYLVNLRYAVDTRDNVVVVAGEELEISRRNRAAFLAALMAYVGGNN